MLSNPNCLLSRVFLRKYCHNANLLKVKATKSSSHGWTGILAGRDLLIKHLGKVVGDGTETIVWFDPWISTTQAMIPRGPLKEDSRDLYVSDLITRGSSGIQLQPGSTPPSQDALQPLQTEWSLQWNCRHKEPSIGNATSSMLRHLQSYNSSYGKQSKEPSPQVIT